MEWVDPDTVDWVGGTDYVDPRPVLPARAICKGGDSCCDGIECGVSSLLLSLLQWLRVRGEFTFELVIISLTPWSKSLHLLPGLGLQ